MAFLVREVVYRHSAMPTDAVEGESSVDLTIDMIVRVWVVESRLVSLKQDHPRLYVTLRVGRELVELPGRGYR
jgi:hypothetical protein